MVSNNGLFNLEAADVYYLTEQFKTKIFSSLSCSAAVAEELCASFVNTSTTLSDCLNLNPDNFNIELTATAAGAEFALIGRSSGATFHQVFLLGRAGCHLVQELFFKQLEDKNLCSSQHDYNGVKKAVRVFFSHFDSSFAYEWFKWEIIPCQKKLREANRYILLEKRRYYTIFNRMAEPAMIVDQDLCILETNQAFDDFFLKSGAEHIGKPCCDVLGTDTCSLSPIEKLLSAKTSFSGFETTLDIKGLRKNVVFSGAFLGDINRENTGGIILIRDVTQRKSSEKAMERLVQERTKELRETNWQLTREIGIRTKAESELRDLATRLKDSNQELEQFAHVASHDLKEPLILIKAFCERLVSKCSESLDEKGLEYLRRIVTSSQQMFQLIEGLLDLSRVTTAARPFEDINLNEIINDVELSLEEHLSQCSGEIKYNDLGILGGDRVQIRQLFQNIIANSLKYRKEGEAPVVELQSDVLDDVCVITIRDNGIGFEPRFRYRIFKPLERLHGRKDYEGTGMGLATCHKIVLRHGGVITAESEPGQGAIFTIRLPLKKMG